MEEENQTQDSEVFERKIYYSACNNLTALDLSTMKMMLIPQSLLNLNKLEQLYLEGNFLLSLPDEFFEKLCNLLWLDLRNNKLESLPGSVGQHRSLTTLLLGGNNLQSLPGELGAIQSLKGLNLVGNPLVDPPHNVVVKGVLEVKAYLLKKLEENGDLNGVGNSNTKSKELSFEPKNSEDVISKEQYKKEDMLCKARNDNARSVEGPYVHGVVELSLDPSQPPYFNSHSNHDHDSYLHGSPCWFIHRPWRTGVFFTRKKIKQEETFLNKSI